MVEERVKRRLAAVLVADVAGYSRLIERDEEGTRKRLRNLYSGLIVPAIDADGGRIVKTTGDGILVEFPSAVDAVRSALKFQSAMADRNAELPQSQRLVFRVGVNLGDVIVEGEDIHGDGVNVAARLEGLCQPGEVYVSGTVHDHVEGKLAASFDDLGDQTFKNIARPVRVFRAWTGGDDTAVPHGEEPAPALPDKPSIVVLPFVNMSDDPDQEYFADGITEDIITELSRFHSLFVIARNSAFHYKGQSPKAQQIGRDLGVRYIVEGSVRKAGNRVRVTAQLVAAGTGNHLWAERYDRDLEDIFAVQDDLVRTIVATVGGRIEVAGRMRASRLNERSLRAYDLYLRAGAAQDRNTREDYELARQYLERAVALDPSLAQAYHDLSLVHFVAWMAHWVDDRDDAFARSMEAANRAVALDPADGAIHSHLGMLHIYRREFDEAGQHCDRAIRLNSNDSRALALYGFYLTAIGEPKKAIEEFDLAMRLNPLEPGWFRWLRGIAHFTSGRYEDAIADLRLVESPINEVRGWLAASYAQAGRLNEAAATLAEFLRVAEREMAVFPGRNLSQWKAYWHGAIEYKNDADFENLYDGLRKAGMQG